MRSCLPLLAAALLLAGCSSPDPADGPDGGDGLAPGEKTLEVSFEDTVQTVGTGVPGVQCPADAANSQVVTWRVIGYEGKPEDSWVTDLVFSLSGAATVNDVDLFVTGPDGTALGSATGSTNQETVEAAGPHPVGDYAIEVRGCSGAGDVTVTASAVVHWIA